jgi:DNA polymerase-3 subunit alpha
LASVHGELEIIIFPNLYERYGESLEVERVIIAKGRLDLKEEENIKMLAEEITFLPREPRQLLITISGNKSFPELMDLKKILTASQGGTPVYLYLEQKEKLILTGQECWVSELGELREKIEDLTGVGSVKIEQMEEDDVPAIKEHQ